MVRGNLAAATSGFALVLCVLCPGVAHASPEDPFGDDWVAIAVSPQAGIGTYGSAGNPDRATQIAMDECNQRANGRRCVVATAIEYGCVAFALNIHTQAWAGGRGPNPEAAMADATAHLPPFQLGDVTGGPQCSDPVSPP